MSVDEVPAFDSVLAALDGARYPLDPGSSKVLRFMLERPEGCDAHVGRDAFEIRFGWTPQRYRYVPRSAAKIVSQLLVLANERRSLVRVRAMIGPATLSGTYRWWSFEPRLLWMDSDPMTSTVSISIRAVDVRGVQPLESSPHALVTARASARRPS
ncbi:MAG TPA: hypothetical protein VGO00_03445 [Kofleriaceae bacterium]|nr:hypothetical protein [Kofleriaceae bacterium]